jgi:hypothetical protein
VRGDGGKKGQCGKESAAHGDAPERFRPEPKPCALKEALSGAIGGVAAALRGDKPARGPESRWLGKQITDFNRRISIKGAVPCLHGTGGRIQCRRD